MGLLVFFIILNIINVILQTVKSLLTNKGGKWSAAVGNAIAYGVYTILLVYMTCELSLSAKVIVVGGCNLIGVFIVKYIEEKMQKDKLWKIELTVRKEKQLDLLAELSKNKISFNYSIVGKWALFNCYCPTRIESGIVKEIAKKYDAKFFANETKIL